MCVGGGVSVSACCGCNGDVCSRQSVCVMEGGCGGGAVRAAAAASLIHARVDTIDCKWFTVGWGGQD